MFTSNKKRNSPHDNSYISSKLPYTFFVQDKKTLDLCYSILFIKADAFNFSKGHVGEIYPKFCIPLRGSRQMVYKEDFSAKVTLVAQVIGIIQ